MLVKVEKMGRERKAGWRWRRDIGNIVLRWIRGKRVSRFFRISDFIDFIDCFYIKF